MNHHKSVSRLQSALTRLRQASNQLEREGGRPEWFHVKPADRALSQVNYAIEHVKTALSEEGVGS